MYHKKNQTRIAKEWKNYRMKAYRCWGRRIKAFKEDSFKQCQICVCIEKITEKGQKRGREGWDKEIRDSIHPKEKKPNKHFILKKYQDIKEDYWREKIVI